MRFGDACKRVYKDRYPLDSRKLNSDREGPPNCLRFTTPRYLPTIPGTFMLPNRQARNQRGDISRQDLFCE